MEGLSFADQILFEHFGQGITTEVPYDCIHQAFEAQAAANPEAIAAIHKNESITYAELDYQANCLAALLTECGITSGDSVALFLQRSIPMLVGMVATLKVGACYVPQHVGVAPESQLAHVIEAASTKVILTLAHLQNKIPVPDKCHCIAVDDFIAQPFDNSNNRKGANGSEFNKKLLSKKNNLGASNKNIKANFNENEDGKKSINLLNTKPSVEVSRDNTCFILFTSGTTGKPNGVRVTHANLCNILLTSPGNLGIKSGMKVSQILSIAFDMAAWEIWGCLAHGATLIIRGSDISAAVESADVVIATPTVLGSLDVERCKNIKVAAVAGEPCPLPLADKWSSFCRFYNSCGPTETTIINTAQHYHSGCKQLTIGKPTPNNTVYILDENKQPCSIGEIGEMWAGGDCVSAGYLDNEQLNRERYAPDPFLGNGRKMFRTRDLGRWTADGELEHFGRTDDQVKICGFRVELDSVSSVLESVTHCKLAVTLKLDDRNLIAFVSPATVCLDEARAAVKERLPYYCMPSSIVAMEQLPMTSRGKVDKRALRNMAENPEETKKTSIQNKIPNNTKFKNKTKKVEALS
ncbi:AMP-binding protein [Aliikangiella coralliicola]|uniref:AMP-binding protein n=2 Tax=Aliikangiella coralliicola TaxID=2592383 RepID=A0A545UEQ1_9GAMM|nr:AMP-binding protein [Aliikangiella coralliicola]